MCARACYLSQDVKNGNLLLEILKLHFSSFVNEFVSENWLEILMVDEEKRKQSQKHYLQKVFVSAGSAYYLNFY